MLPNSGYITINQVHSEVQGWLTSGQKDGNGNIANHWYPAHTEKGVSLESGRFLGFLFDNTPNNGKTDGIIIAGESGKTLDNGVTYYVSFSVHVPGGVYWRLQFRQVSGGGGYTIMENYGQGNWQHYTVVYTCTNTNTSRNIQFLSSGSATVKSRYYIGNLAVSTGAVYLNDSDVRALAGKPTSGSTIYFSNFHGKT